MKNYVIIDDDETNNLICKIIIQQTVPDATIFTFTEPANGLQQLKKLAESSVDVILFLDLNMPEITGWDIIKAYLDFPENLRRRIQINILTSSINNKDKEKAIDEYRVNRFFSKPLTKEMVESIIH
jgi:CheY-like chemotaxis protein